MLALITGGSGSGKSAWAEGLAQRLCPGPKLYLATMRPTDDEDLAHQAGEYASVSGLMKSAKIFANALLRLAGA